jgi:hypothetical protein
MKRFARVDSAHRFLLQAISGLGRRARLAPAAVMIGIGPAISCSPAIAQSASKGSAIVSGR